MRALSLLHLSPPLGLNFVENHSYSFFSFCAGRCWHATMSFRSHTNTKFEIIKKRLEIKHVSGCFITPHIYVFLWLLFTPSKSWTFFICFLYVSSAALTLGLCRLIFTLCLHFRRFYGCVLKLSRVAVGLD